MVRILTISFFLAVIFCPDKVLPYDPESRADLASRFSGYNFSRELELKEGSRFLCPSTFLTSERAILHERVLTSILGDKVGMNQKPTLFIVVGASGSGKSYLINSLIEGNGKTCPYGRPEDIGEFLFDGPRAKERNTFPVKAPKTILSVSGDAMMEKLPEYISYQRWLDSRSKNDQGTIYIDVANSCHLEAAQLAQSVVLTAVESHLDIVFEGTGQRTAFLFELASLALENSYSIHLIHVNTDLETCVQRAAKRFEETGRGVPYDIVKRSYLLSRRTFRQVASLAHFSSVWRAGTCTQGFMNPTPGLGSKRNPLTMKR